MAISVPGVWNYYLLNGKKLPAFGHATYLLTVKNADIIAEGIARGGDGEVNEKQKTNLSLISYSGKRLTYLVNDILDYANPARTGYTFTGWDLAFNNVTSHLTITAQYSKNNSGNNGGGGGGSGSPAAAHPADTRK